MWVLKWFDLNCCFFGLKLIKDPVLPSGGHRVH